MKIKLNTMSKGLYIVFEGIVGTGKTTQSKLLHQRLQEMFPTKNMIWTYEPGGSEISDTVRKVVQGTKFNEEMHPLTDVYLYAASRAQTLSTIVKPTVNAGGIVIADRSYITSLAIQGGAQKQGIETVLSVNEKAIETVTPDLVIYLYMDPTSSMHRTFDEDGDKWESKTTEFNYEIAKGYDVAAELPSLKKIWNRIDIDKSMDIPSVAEMVWQVVEPLVTTISQ